MPKLRIPESSARAIHAAAALYEHELTEILAARENRAGDDYAKQLVIRRLEDEVDAIQVALRIRAHLEEDHIARITGVEVRDATASAIHSALLLQKAVFVRELALLSRGAPAQQENASVIRAAIDLLGRDISRVWAKYGLSEFLPDVLLSWRLKNSPEHLHPLIAWIEKNGGAQSRAWFVTDTNFFLESRATFEQVDWHGVWGVERLVLVVPAAMVRELDDMKSNARRPKLQKRARQVMPLLARYAEPEIPGTPSRVRDGVELLVLDVEPQTYPSGFDPSLPDDRLIATALELRQALADADVRVVSEDVGPRVKLRRFDMSQVSLPAAERRSESDDD